MMGRVGFNPREALASLGMAVLKRVSSWREV